MSAAPPTPPPAGTAFELARLQQEQLRAGRSYLEFLRVPALSLGLYRLAAGAEDPQRPHAEEEVYLVLSGRGRLRVGEQDHRVGPGSLVFVPARAPHRFHSIEDDLGVLVFFAPAETGA